MSLHASTHYLACPSIPSILEILAALSPMVLEDSLLSCCQVSFFMNFSTDRPPVYLHARGTLQVVDKLGGSSFLVDYSRCWGLQ